jgi:hypothetical protein
VRFSDVDERTCKSLELSSDLHVHAYSSGELKSTFPAKEHSVWHVSQYHIYSAIQQTG